MFPFAKRKILEEIALFFSFAVACINHQLVSEEAETDLIRSQLCVATPTSFLPIFFPTTETLRRKPI